MDEIKNTSEARNRPQLYDHVVVSIVHGPKDDPVIILKNNFFDKNILVPWFRLCKLDKLMEPISQLIET